MTKAEFKKRIQIITAICIVVLLAAIIILAGQLVSIVSLKNKEKALKAEIDAVNKETIVAGQELEYRESESFIEQYAREVLGLIKKGEKVFIIKD